MRRQIVAGALVAASVLGLAASTPAQAQSCFFINQWQGWKAANDHTVYIHVLGGDRVYRLDMSGACPALLDSQAVLVNRARTSSICSKNDWDIRISQGQHTIVTGCLVEKMTQLTPDQIAALPQNQRP